MIFCFIAGGVALILGVFFLIRTYKTGSTETKVSMVCFGLGVIGILEGIAINIDSTLLMCLAPAIAIIGGPLLQIALLGIVSYLIEIIIKAQEKDGKKVIKIIVITLIVIALLVAIGVMIWSFANESNPVRKNECESCGREWSAGDANGNFINISKTGMCNNCYENFKYAQKESEKYGN